jgi:hypothetical protein
MPEIMKANSRQPSANEQGTERIPEQVNAILWLAQAIWKHEIKVRPAITELRSLLLLPFTMLLQRLSGVRRYRDAATTPTCFRLGKDKASGSELQCCAYQEDTIVQIHVAPSQR